MSHVHYTCTVWGTAHVQGNTDMPIHIVHGQHNCDACAAHLIGTGNILVIDFTPDHSIAVLRT